MKRKVKIKSLPKAQYAGQPSMVLTPEQQDIWRANQNMFGTPPPQPITVPDYMGDFEQQMTQEAAQYAANPLMLIQTPQYSENFKNNYVPPAIPQIGKTKYSTPSTPQLVTPGSGFNDIRNQEQTLREGEVATNVAPNIAELQTPEMQQQGMAALSDAAGAFDMSSLSGLSNIPQGAGFVPFIQSGIFANLGNRVDEARRNADFKNRFLSDNMYASIPEGYSGNRGDYTLNQQIGLGFRPDEAVYGQFGKIAKYGGSMKRKIKITGLPQAAYGGTQNKASVDEMYPYNSNVRRAAYSDMLEGESQGEVRQYAEEVPREIANIEAEKGETIVKPNDEGLLNMYKIGGKRHYEGGTPLQANPNDFIFSDTKDMKIKDPDILESFGMQVQKKGRKGYTPAEISKKFNLNDPAIQKALNDPKADRIAKATAERMYDNNLSQLGKLALIQEGRKGFPQGAPDISMPYMQKAGMDPSMFMPDVMTPQDATFQMGKAQYGGAYERYLQAAKKEEADEAVQQQIEAEALRNKRNWENFTGANIKGPGGYLDYILNFIPSASNYLAFGNFEPYSETFDRYISQGNLPDNNVTRAVAQGADIIPTLGAANARTAAQSLNLLTKGTRSKLRPFVEDALEYASNKLPSLKSLKSKQQLYKELVEKYGSQVANQVEQALSIIGPVGTTAAIVASKVGIDKLSEDEKQMIEEDPTIVERFEKIEPVEITAKDTTPVQEDIRIQNTRQKLENPVIPTPQIEDRSLIDTNELEFYQKGGPVKRDLRVAKDKQTGKYAVYEVGKDGKAKKLFGTYVGDNTTPGGASESWVGGPEQLKKYITQLQEQGVDLSNVKTAKDFQSVLYNKTLEQNPGSIEKMWSDYGTTLELSKYPNLISKLNKIGVKTNKSNQGYTLDFSDLSDDQKKEAFNELEVLYDDDKIGARTLALDFDTPEPAPPVTPEPEPGLVPPVTPKDEIGTYKQPDIDLTTTTPAEPGKYYVQDLMNTALAAGDRLGLKKYLPYDTTLPQPVLMDPTFYDPSRELAATSEMANIGTRNVGQFTGPQSFNARFSGIQGNAAKNAANILGRYNNLNVGVANQFEQGNKSLINDFNIKNAIAKNDYFTKTVTANQQMDNAKRAAKNRTVGSATNAITNKAMTQVLNNMYPEFAIDPTVGGELVSRFSRNPFERNANYGQATNSMEAKRKQLQKMFPEAEPKTIDEKLLGNYLSTNNRRNRGYDSRADFLDMLAGVQSNRSGFGNRGMRRRRNPFMNSYNNPFGTY